MNPNSRKMLVTVIGLAVVSVTTGTVLIATIHQNRERARIVELRKEFNLPAEAKVSILRDEKVLLSHNTLLKIDLPASKRPDEWLKLIATQAYDGGLKRVDAYRWELSSGDCQTATWYDPKRNAYYFADSF